MMQQLVCILEVQLQSWKIFLCVAAAQASQDKVGDDLL